MVVEIPPDLLYGVTKKFFGGIMKAFKKKKKKNISINSSEIPILNLSGHTLPSQATGIIKSKFQYFQIVDVKIGSYNDEKLVEGATKIIKEAVEKMNNPLDLETGNFIIIPPGFAPLSSILMAVLHGISGHFPKIWTFKRKDGAYILSDKIYDLQDIRIKSRESRSSH